MDQKLVQLFPERESNPTQQGRGFADPFGRFMKLPDVERSVGLSRPQIYKLMRREDRPFPPPIKVETSSLWVERDVVAWKQAEIEKEL